MNAHAVNLLAKVVEFYDPSGILRYAVKTISQSIIASGQAEIIVDAQQALNQLRKDPQVKRFEEYLADYAQCPAIFHEISNEPTELTSVPLSGSVFCSRLSILAPLAVFLLFVVLFINRRNALRMSRYEIYNEVRRKAHYARELVASGVSIITIPLWPRRAHDIREGSPEIEPEVSPRHQEEEGPIASQEEVSHYGAVAAKDDLSSEQTSSSHSRSRSASPLNSDNTDD